MDIEKNRSKTVKSYKKTVLLNEPAKTKVPQAYWTTEDSVKPSNIRTKVNKACEEAKNNEDKNQHLKNATTEHKSSDSYKSNVIGIVNEKNVMVNNPKTAVSLKQAKVNLNENVKISRTYNLPGTKKVASSTFKLHPVNAGRIYFSKDCESTYKLPRKIEQKAVSKKEDILKSKSCISQVMDKSTMETAKKMDIDWKKKPESDERNNENWKSKPVPLFNKQNYERLEKIKLPSEERNDKYFNSNLPHGLNANPNIAKNSSQPIDNSSVKTISNNKYLSAAIQSSEHLSKAISNELDKCRIASKTRLNSNSMSSSSDSSSSDRAASVHERMQYLDKMASDLCKMVELEGKRKKYSNINHKETYRNEKPSNLVEEGSVPIEKIVDKMATILSKNSVKAAELNGKPGNSVLRKKELENSNSRVKGSKSLSSCEQKSGKLKSHPANCESFINKVVHELPVYYRREEEVAAAVKIQAAFRGFKVRKITKQLLQPKAKINTNKINDLTAKSQLGSIGCFYRSSQLDKCGSLKIAESYYGWNNCNLPPYVKPFLNLTENNNINEFLESAFSLSDQKSGAEKMKKASSLRVKSGKVHCSSDAPKDKYQNTDVVGSSIDLLTFEAKKTRKAAEVRPTEDKSEWREISENVSGMKSMIDSRSDSKKVSVHSSFKSEHSFLPHKAKCLAAGDLSQRVKAELLYQDTVGLALGHLKELENLSNALNWEEKFAFPQRTSSFNRQVEQQNQLTGVVEGSVQHRSGEKFHKTPMILDNYVAEILRTNSNNVKNPSIITMQNFSQRAFQTESKFRSDQISVTSQKGDLKLESCCTSENGFQLESNSTVQISSGPEEDSCESRYVSSSCGNDETHTNSSQLEYTVELVPSPTEEPDKIVVKAVRDEKYNANCNIRDATTVKMHPLQNKIASDNLKHEYSNDLLNTPDQIEYQSQPKSQKLIELVMLDNKSNPNPCGTVEFLRSSLSKMETVNYSPNALQSTLNVVSSMQAEENLRAEHQMTLLKLQEHSLMQEAKAKLEQIEMEGGQNVHHKQRVVRHQLKVQLSHIRCLIETQSLAAEQKRQMYWQYLQLLSSSGKSIKNSAKENDFLKASDRVDTPHPRLQQDGSQNATEESFDLPLNISSVSTQEESNKEDLSGVAQRQTFEGGDVKHRNEVVLRESLSTNVNMRGNLLDSRADTNLPIQENADGQHSSYPICLIKSAKQTKSETRATNTVEEVDQSTSKIETRQRRKLPSAMRLSLSPKTAFNHTRRYSSESDDSFTLSQNETASDVSDSERRLLTLKDELASVKAEAEKLFREKRKLRRERIASQELALQKQISAYNSYITRTKLEVSEESQMRDLSGVKPMIKKGHCSRESIDKSRYQLESIDVMNELPNDGWSKKVVTAPIHETLPTTTADKEQHSEGRDRKESETQLCMELTDDGSRSGASSIMDSAVSQKDSSFEKTSDSSACSTHNEPFRPDEAATSSLLEEGFKVQAAVVEYRSKIAKRVVSETEIMGDKIPSLVEIDQPSPNEGGEQSAETTQYLVKEVSQVKESASHIADYIFNLVLSECVQNMIDIFVRKGNTFGITKIYTGPKALHREESVSVNCQSRLQGKYENFGTFDRLDELKSPDQTNSQTSFSPEELSNRLLSMNLWDEKEPQKCLNDLAQLDEDFTIKGHEGSWFDNLFWTSTDGNRIKDQNAEAAYLEELQKLKEVFPDLVLREVPNKPPPPYTPPKAASSTIVSPPADKVMYVSSFEVPYVERPHRTGNLRQNRTLGSILTAKIESVIPSDAKELNKIVQCVVEHFYDHRMSRTPYEQISFDSHIFRGFSVKTGKEESTATFNRLLFDLCKHFMSEEQSNFDSIAGYTEVVSRKVRLSLNKETNTRKETWLTQWTKAKQDKVGRLIIEGILSEEHHWVNMCDPNIACHVKNQISNDIFSSLLDQTISSFEDILSSKFKKR